MTWCALLWGKIKQIPGKWPFQNCGPWPRLTLADGVTCFLCRPWIKDRFMAPDIEAAHRLLIEQKVSWLSSLFFSLGSLRGSKGSLVAQLVKNPPAMQETHVRSLGQEDSPGEGNGNPLQYSCLEILWTEEPGGLPSMGLQEMTSWLNHPTTRGSGVGVGSRETFSYSSVSWLFFGSEPKGTHATFKATKKLLDKLASAPCCIQTLTV